MISSIPVWLGSAHTFQLASVNAARLSRVTGAGEAKPNPLLDTQNILSRWPGVALDSVCYR